MLELLDISFRACWRSAAAVTAVTCLSIAKVSALYDTRHIIMFVLFQSVRLLAQHVAKHLSLTNEIQKIFDTFRGHFFDVKLFWKSANNLKVKHVLISINKIIPTTNKTVRRSKGHGYIQTLNICFQSLMFNYFGCYLNRFLKFENPFSQFWKSFSKNFETVLLEIGKLMFSAIATCCRLAVVVFYWAEWSDSHSVSIPIYLVIWFRFWLAFGFQ